MLLCLLTTIKAPPFFTRMGLHKGEVGDYFFLIVFTFLTLFLFFFFFSTRSMQETWDQQVGSITQFLEKL